MSDVNVVRKQERIALSDVINTYFYLFCVVLIPAFWELNCHTVCTVVVELTNMDPY
jgi:hypothetical protein